MHRALLRLAGGAALTAACLCAGVWLERIAAVLPAPMFGMVLMLVVLPLLRRIAPPLADGTIALADGVLRHMVLVLLPVSVAAVHLLWVLPSGWGLVVLLLLSPIPPLLLMGAYLHRRRF
ncbi:MAG: hypothetical protein ISN29_02270 [Gammaproteobacteria bacterium AqS3]|nr:hypothetical protein [Gammaproteobacteria bacterium AqS3]